MRVNFLAFAVAGIAFVAGCGDGGAPAPTPVSLVVPSAGRYQATLVGYSEQGCDDTLSEPVGALESAATIGFLTEGQLQLSGARIWPFGAVALRPGDPADQVERLAWRGSQDLRVARGTCTLGASATLLYFPVDADRGNLNAQVSYSAAGGACAQRLPCRNVAIWSLAYYP